jgi:hypothetical protein
VRAPPGDGSSHTLAPDTYVTASDGGGHQCEEAPDQRPTPLVASPHRTLEQGIANATGTVVARVQHSTQIGGGRKKGEKRCLVDCMKILLFGLFALALITTAMITHPMSAGTALVTVQTLPTLPDWRAP